MDISFFGPLKQHWKQVCHDFYQSSPGRIITKFNFSQLFAKSWLRAITPENICSGFRHGGVVPFNPDAILPPNLESNHVDTSNYQTDLNKENEVNLANISEATFTPEKALFMEHLDSSIAHSVFK